MKYKYTFFTIMLLLVNVYSKIKSYTINDDSCNLDYDYYILSLSYKPGMCHHNNFCTSSGVLSEVKWTLHGLWPSKLREELYHSHNCLNTNLDDLSADITKDLVSFWPTLSNGSSHAFHSHEWEKHGSCVSFCYYGVHNDQSQHFYFSKSLQLRDKFDPQKYLSEGSFELEELLTIFQEHLGVSPMLICKTDRNSEEQYLSEVRIPLYLQFKPYKGKRFKSRCNNRKRILL